MLPQLPRVAWSRMRIGLEVTAHQRHLSLNPELSHALTIFDVMPIFAIAKKDERMLLSSNIGYIILDYSSMRSLLQKLDHPAKTVDDNAENKRMNL